MALTEESIGEERQIKHQEIENTPTAQVLLKATHTFPSLEHST